MSTEEGRPVVEHRGSSRGGTMTGSDLTPEAVARLFHEAYERLAPDFGYRTREASAKPWDDVPTNNRALMTATAAAVLAAVVPPIRVQIAEELWAEAQRVRAEGGRRYRP